MPSESGPLAGLIERLRAQMEQRRAENEIEFERRRAQFGFSHDAECGFCGDTGKDPVEGSLCFCDAGDRERDRIRRITTWPTLVPLRWEGWRLDSCPNVDAVRKTRGWLNSGPIRSGCNLVINGPVGTGKTGVAVGALYQLHMQGYRVGWRSAIELKDDFRQEERGRFAEWRPGQPTIEQLKRLDCLLLDDLGGEKMTEYVAERFYVILNARHSARRPTIITTNLTGSAVAERLGQRLASRLRDNCVSFAAKGPDYRTKDDPNVW